MAEKIADPRGTVLEQRLGHRFRDRSLLATALTPPSAGIPRHNQRLEFLGDALLQSCASLLIFREHPDWDEGSLSKLRGLLVSTDALLAWALDLGLTLAEGPRSSRKAIAPTPLKAHADAVEALLAAVYLDVLGAGGDPFRAVQALVEARHLARVREAYVGIWQKTDSKTTLQERAAALGLPAPVYELIERTGQDHVPLFRVRVTVGLLEATASAGVLKRAQAEAARVLLESLPS